jgi:mRNA interferase RelE/StbE
MDQKKWSIRYSPEFKKEWKRLDPSLQKRVIGFFAERLNTQQDPKLFAKPLSGNLKSFWRYRVGDYRLVCQFYDEGKVIYLLRIGHRSEIYD